MSYQPRDQPDDLLRRAPRLNRFHNRGVIHYLLDPRDPYWSFVLKFSLRAKRTCDRTR